MVHIYYLSLSILCFFFIITPVHAASLNQNTFSLTPAKRLITLTGFTRPLVKKTISSEVQGKCLNVYVEAGDIIPATTVIARIDPTFVQLDIQANNITIKELEDTLKLEEKEVKRYQNLISNKSSSQAKLDRTLLQRDTSRHRLTRLMNTQAQLNEHLLRHTIRGHAGYQVIERLIEPGELVSLHSPIARLGDFQQLIVPLSLTHKEYQVILDKKNKISISFPDLAITANAILLRAIPEFDPKTRKIPVELLIGPDTTAGLPPYRAGLRVSIPILLPEAENIFSVPLSSLQNRHEFYWLTMADGKKITVMYLGPNKHDSNMVRISGKQLNPAYIFLKNPTPSTDTE